MPLPDPVSLTEEQKAGGFMVIAQLTDQIYRYAAEVERWGDLPINDLRDLAYQLMLVSPRKEADAYSRGKLQGLIYRSMVGNQSDVPPEPVVEVPPVVVAD